MSEGSFYITQMNQLLDWGRQEPLLVYPFLSSCCAMEYMAVMGPHQELARSRAVVPCIAPAQADLLLVAGTVNTTEIPRLRKAWEQMNEPKWVVALGACACTGGCYRNYATLPGIDHIIPVDLYVPGCPPRPEQFLEGLVTLREKIRNGELQPRA